VLTNNTLCLLFTLPGNICVTRERERAREREGGREGERARMQNFGYKISWNDEKDGSIQVRRILVRQSIRNELRMRIPEAYKYFKTTPTYRCNNGCYSTFSAGFGATFVFSGVLY